MSLVTIAEVLSGETLVSAGGPVDRLTAVTGDDALWQAAGERLVAETREAQPVDAVQEEFALR